MIFDFMHHRCLGMVYCPSCHPPKVFNVVVFVVECLLICKLKHEMKGDETRRDEPELGHYLA